MRPQISDSFVSFYALGSFEKPIVLIMGGVDKGNDYTQIEELVTKKVKEHENNVVSSSSGGGGGDVPNTITNKEQATYREKKFKETTSNLLLFFLLFGEPLKNIK